MQNWRPSVDYIFYVELMVIYCIFHAENSEFCSMIVFVVTYIMYLTFLHVELSNFLKKLHGHVSQILEAILLV
jgi:hypothetical protein